MAHKKPTKEELEEKNKQIQEELEKEDDTPEDEPEAPTDDDTPEDDDTTEEDTDSTDDTDDSEGEEDDVEDDTPEEKEETEETKEPPKKEEKKVDYKEKFKESSREAQIRSAREKKMNEAIDKANELPAPTEDELKSEYPEWDDMTETERRFATDNFVNKRFREELTKARQEGKNLEEWSKKVDEFTDDPKTLADYPELESRVEEFKNFASKPTRRGLDFEDLVPAFLYDATRKGPPKKGRMFQKGSGGPNDKGKKKNNKISIEEGAKLKQTNYSKYKQYLQKGLIETNIE